MPIHDQGYQQYTGVRQTHSRAWMVIARTGVRTLLRRRAFIAILLVSWLPFLVSCVMLYASATIPQATFFGPTPRLFRRFLGVQELFLFFVTVYAGAGLIANDRRANALQIYLSKPLTAVDYIAGKFAILFSCALVVTWVPAMLLLILEVVFAGSFEFLVRNSWLLPAATIFALVQALTSATLMLALSSLSNNSRYVGVMYSALLFFTPAIYGVLFVLTRDPRAGWFSLPHNLSQVGDALFQMTTGSAIETAGAVVLLGALVVGSLAVVRWRVQAVDIVT